MITRDLANIQVVSALNTPSTGTAYVPAPFHSCTVAGFTAAGCGVLSTFTGYNGFGGIIVDRLGLREDFHAVAVAVNARANVAFSAESTALVKYYGLSIGLQHSSTTCAGNFSDLSTGDWVIDYPLAQVSTATSTSGSFYTVEGAGVAVSQSALMSTAVSSSTSTGYAFYAGRAPVFSITGANRYLRPVIAPHIEVTGCGSPGMTADAVLVFADPGKGPHSTGIRGRIHVSTAATT